MADALTRLAGPLALAAAAADVYVAPGAGAVVSVRAIHVTNESAAVHTFRLSIGNDAAGTRLFCDVEVEPGSAGFDWDGLVVLAAGENLQAYASAAAALTLVISGVVST